MTATGDAGETASQRADRTRAELADPIDRQLDPLGRAAMDALAPIAGWRVLDVGCGAGQTVAQLAARVGDRGHVTGVDIAPQVLAVARRRTAPLRHVSLVEGDASRIALPAAGFDAVYSRFGTMFFAEPILAFRHLRRLLRPGGRIGFVCWQGLRENELDRAPLEAAGAAFRETPHLGFADPDRIRAVLRDSGFGAVAVEPFEADVSCGGVEDTLPVVTRVGALGAILREAPEMRSAAEARVRLMLEQRAVAGRVSLGAATWIATATAP